GKRLINSRWRSTRSPLRFHARRLTAWPPRFAAPHPQFPPISPRAVAEMVSRIGSLLHYRQRLGHRTGVPTPARPRFELDPSQGLRKTLSADRGNQTHAHCLGSEADG